MRSNADLRTQGWKYCVYSVVQSSYGYHESASGRTAYRVKGGKCAILVGPRDITRLGVPVCHTHERLFFASIKADEKRRQELRDKYDPGPLPLEEV